MEDKENHTMKKSKSESQQTQNQTRTRTRTHMDELPHSPLRSDFPLRSDEPEPPDSLQEKSHSKAIVAVDKYPPYSPHLSPLSAPPKPAPENTNSAAAKFQSPVVVLNHSVKDGAAAAATIFGPGGVGDGVGFGGGGRSGGGGGGGIEDGGERREGKAVTSILNRSKRDAMVKRATLGFRVCEVVLCLISFSVMAADKTQGWSGDSFDRYKEYRYCLSVTVIAFVYSGFQAYDLAYHLITGKHVIQHHLRCHFDFFMDQILAYLLISASSSAATQVDDWQSNWGKDEFTEMASASVGMAFLAFTAFAFSSLTSGYNFFIGNSA